MGRYQGRLRESPRCGGLLAAPAPPDAWTGLKPRDTAAGLLQLVRDRLYISALPMAVIHPTPRFIHMPARTGFRAELRALIEQTLVDRDSLAIAYNVPPRSPPVVVCYLQRWRYLLKRYSPVAVKAMGKTDPVKGDMRLIASVHRWLVDEE